MLTYHSHEANGVLVLTAEEMGETGGERPASLREWLYKAIEAHPDGRCVIDFSALNYLTSGDIGFLLTLTRRIAARKGKVVLLGVDPYVQDVLGTMRLLPLFTIVATFAEALERLAAPAPPAPTP